MTIFEKGDEIMSDEIFIQQNLDWQGMQLY